MNQAFKEALEKKKIFHFSKAKSLVDKELKVALDDLAEAKDRFKNERYKYATINAYYGTFHAARALLFSKGYRERSHYALYIAIEALFVETGMLEKLISPGEEKSIPNLKRTLLESVLWGVKLNGCSVSEKEINQIIEMESV